MSYYLNLDNEMFEYSLNSKIFIYKSKLIKYCNELIKTNDRFMCVTRPRRFGKTMALYMLNAYYSKGCNSKELFDNLKISKETTYLNHLNKHNVLWIDMASLYTKLDNKNDFVRELKNYLILDLKEAFPSINYEGLKFEDSIIKIKSSLNEKFIFLIDEWDVIFREQENNTKLIDEYLMFLRSLFKASDVSRCIDLVYMTGILPIRRYSSESALNMFKEYNMLDAYDLTEFVGFTENEVKNLCDKYSRDFNQIKA